MITFKHRGNFSKTEKFFNRVLRREYLNVIEKYGEIGCQVLASATPVDSGATAESWTFEISHDWNVTKIAFLNTNMNEGYNVAILLRYGHGTGTGGFVAGRDFISPAIRPVFDQLADDVWKEVTGK